MHETSLAADVLARCAELAAGREILRVRVRATGHHGGELEAALCELARIEMPFAVFELQVVAPRLACPCGFEGELDEACTTGHLAVCPSCGCVQPLDDHVEVLALHLRSEPAPDGARGEVEVP